MLKTSLNLQFKSIITANNNSLTPKPKISFKGIQGNLSADKVEFSTMSDVSTAQRIWQNIENPRTIVVQSHAGADGDSLASGIAMLNTIKEKYPDKQVYFYSPGNIPSYLKSMPGLDTITTKLPDGFSPDLAICVDCDYDTVDGADVYKRAKSRIRIDHHHSKVKPLPNEIHLVDVNAPSTTSLLYHKLFKPFDISISAQSAKCLLTGLMTDTGVFKYVSPECKALETRDELLSLYAKDGSFSVESIGKEFDQNRVVSRELKDLEGNLRRRASIKMFRTNMGQVVKYVAVSRQKMDFYGVKPDDADLCSILKSLLGFLANHADIGLILKETEKPDAVSVILKSKQLGLADFVTQHGGGGHSKIGGFSMNGTARQVTLEVIDAMSKHIFRPVV